MVMRTVFSISFVGAVLCSSIMAVVTEPSVSLQVSLPKQDGTYQVTIGQPFQMVVTVQDAERNTSKPTIRGIEKCSVLGTTQSSSMTLHNVNNMRSMRSTNTFVYTLVVQGQGVFELGPAIVQHSNKKIASNVVQLVSQAASPNSTSVLGAQPGDPVIIQVNAPKKSLVVGEPMVISYLFYIQGQIRPQGLAFGAAPDALFKELPDGPIRQEVHNGISYQVQEKRYVYTPLQAGKLRIEPTTLNYLAPAPSQRRRSAFGVFEDDFFDAMFGGGMTQRSVASEPIEFTVQPLPAAPPGSSVQGIMTVDRIGLQLEREQIAAQEPLMLTLTVEGKGDLDRLTAPALKVPASVKWYESKSSVQLRTPQDPGVGSKQFEYVLQPQQPGSWQIDMAPLQVYDPVQSRYMTHTVQPVSLTVSPGLPNVLTNANVPPASFATSTADVQSAILPTSLGNDIHHIIHEWQSDSLIPQAIPWNLFWRIIGAILLALMLWSWYDSRLSFGRRPRKIRFDHAFVTGMQKKLQNLIQKENACELHQFFIEFLSAKLHVPVDDLDDQVISQQLLQHGFEVHKVDDFMQFLNHCASLRFGAGYGVQQDALLHQAQRWLVLLGA